MMKKFIEHSWNFLKKVVLIDKKEYDMKKVEKTWGWEHWFVNNTKYCGKLLFVRKDEWSSKGKYHFHKLKDETFFVIEGGLILKYVEDGEFKRTTLGRYQSFHVPPGMKHKYTAFTEEGCKFVEASTTHRDDDSYRVSWDKGKNRWIA